MRASPPSTTHAYPPAINAGNAGTARHPQQATGTYWRCRQCTMWVQTVNHVVRCLGPAAVARAMALPGEARALPGALRTTQLTQQHLRLPLRHATMDYVSEIAGRSKACAFDTQRAAKRQKFIIVCAYYFPGGRCRFRQSAPETGAGAACAQAHACAWQRSSGAEREKIQAPATAAWTATRHTHTFRTCINIANAHRRLHLHVTRQHSTLSTCQTHTLQQLTAT
jgi:hypothetical protein